MKRATLLLGAVGSLPSPSAAEWTREEVLRELVRCQDQITSLNVVSHMEEQGTGRPDGAYLRFDLRVFGGSRFSGEVAHGSPGSQWEADYNRMQLYLVDGECMTVMPARRIFNRFPLPDRELPEGIAADPFFISSGWWPLRSAIACPELLGQTHNLRRFLDTGLSVVDERPDPVHGMTCFFAEREGVGRVWLDPERGFAVRARDWLSPSTGAIAVMLRVDELRHVSGGFWVPGQFRILVSDGQTGDPRDAIVVEQRRVSVAHAEANTLDPQIFDYSPPPGAFQYDREHDNKWRQVEPGGLDLLDNLADGLRANADRGRTGGRLGSTTVPVLAGCLIGCGLFWFQRRRRGSRG